MRIAAALVLLGSLLHAEPPPPIHLAVSRDGRILAHKEMTLDATAQILRWKSREYPLASLYLIEAEDTSLIWAADYDSRMRGYELLAHGEILDRATRLFRSAVKFKDPALARRLFDLALENGLDAKTAEKNRKKLRALEAKSPKPSKRAPEVHAEANKLASIQADLLFVRTARELEANPEVGLRMLRDLLVLAPRHEKAGAALVARAPKEFALGGPRAWLDWQLDIEGRGAKLGANDTFVMRQSRKYWRKDLIGIETGPVLIVTPVRDTRVLGRTLGCCRLLTDLLEELFGDYPRRRKKFDPLRIFLYGSRDEYKQQSRAARPKEDAKFLERTAGHYSPEEGISRLFWEISRDAEARTVGTAVHELTHHWLADANPAYSRSEGRRSTRCPGFWIVEGFAKFLEEGVYDIDNRTCSLFDRRAASLDTIASMNGSEKLIPWTMLYEGTSVTFWALPKENDIRVRRRWHLGSEILSTTQLWYEQSAATCQFLYHADGGKHRKALVAFVVNHYTNQRKKMSTQQAFGMTPEELGKRVEQFAVAVAKGWEPPEG